MYERGCVSRPRVYIHGRMSAQHASPVAARESVAPSGYPLSPRPFNMGEWRKQWAAWWSQANREAVRAVIPEGK